MTAPPPAAETALLTFLNEIGVDHKLHRHVPLFTVEDSKAATAHLPGAHTKNFFLKQKKGGFVLVTCLADRQIKIKHLEKMIEAKRLSFGSVDDLLSVLGVHSRLGHAPSPHSMIARRPLCASSSTNR